MSTVKEDLLAAAHYIEKRGWVQRSFYARDGRCCAIGAISATAMSPQRDKAARDALNKYLYAEFGMSAVLFNDTTGRTKDEVVTALRAAAEVAS